MTGPQGREGRTMSRPNFALMDKLAPLYRHFRQLETELDYLLWEASSSNALQQLRLLEVELDHLLWEASGGIGSSPREDYLDAENGDDLLHRSARKRAGYA